MKKIWKSVVATGLIVATVALGPATANAGWNYNNNNNNNAAAAVAAGFIGLAAGAIIGSAMTRPAYPYAGARYYGPPAPWSPAWYTYCSSKYRSFDPNSGYFLGYDGQYHFCR